MQSNNSFACTCPDLRVRTDHGHSSGEYKSITVVDCMAEIEKRPCKYSGNCITRRSYATGTKLKKGDNP